MARVNVPGSSGSSSRNPNYDPSSSDGPVSSEWSDIREKVLRSSTYREAYNLFSQPGVDPIWLQKLQSVLDSAVDAKETWFDEVGLVNNFVDKQQATYQYCIQQIQALISEYQGFVNSLPSTQVSQLSQAGINAGVTGAGVNASSIPNVGTSIDPTALSSFNNLDGVAQMVNFATTVSGGMLSIGQSVADTVLKFKNLGLSRDQFEFTKEQFEQNKLESFANFKSSLSKDGVLLKATSWDELKDDVDWFNNASSRSKNLYNAWKEYSDSIKYGPLVVSGIKAGSYNPDDIYQTVNAGSDSVYGWNFGYGASLLDSFSEVGDFEMDLLANEFTHSISVRTKRVEEEVTDEDIAYAEARTAQAEKAYNRKKALIYLNRVINLEEQAKKGNFWAQIKLNDMMFNNTWQESILYAFGENPEEMFKLLTDGSYGMQAIDLFKALRDKLKNKE